MAAYSAFYDTSGHRSSQGDDSAIVTAGLLASEAQWVGFEREWNALLAAAQIPYLHMRQLRNAFDGRPDEQARFLDKAVRLLRKRMTMAFVVSVIPRDFRVVSEEFELARVMESPHQVAVGTCALLSGTQAVEDESNVRP